MRILILSILFMVGTLSGQELYFPPITNGNWEGMSLEDAGFCQDNEQALYDYLEATNTDAFLLLKDGKVVIEQYFGDFTAASPHVWNSAGKSLMAVAVGIAAEIDSVDLQAPASDYLGVGWTDCPEDEVDIKVIHQLTLTSGLDDQAGDNNCTSPECLVCLAAPGGRWAYHTSVYTLLGSVIETATDESLNDFITSRIRQPTGMTGQYINIGNNRIFISNARSMARFGLLILNQGFWDETPVLADTTYFNNMVSSSQDMNPAYGYLWWLNGKSSYKLPGIQVNFPGQIMLNAPATTFAAIGKNGQLINVVPDQGLVMVRMGSLSEGGLAPIRINNLSCTTTSTEANLPAQTTSLLVYPNPASNLVTLTSDKGLLRVDVYTGNGRRLRSLPLTGQQQRIPLTGLPKGPLYLRISTKDGAVTWKRVMHLGR
jgi:CubicO group peptidase (beta-lactamase class C family)